MGAAVHRYWDGARWTSDTWNGDRAPGTSSAPVADVVPEVVAAARTPMSIPSAEGDDWWSPVAERTAPAAPEVVPAQAAEQAREPDVASSALPSSPAIAAAVADEAERRLRQVGAGILIGWSAIVVLRVLAAETVWSISPIYNGPGIGSLFSSAFGSMTVLGSYTGALQSVNQPIRDSGELIRLLSPLLWPVVVCGVAAALSLDESRARMAQVAAAAVGVNLALLVVLNLPISGDVEIADFAVGLSLSAVLPVTGAVLLTRTAISSGESWSRTPRERKAIAIGDQVPVDNGLRFGAALLDGVIQLFTLYVGYYLWSVFIWQRGQTPAKQLLGLVVIDLRTEAPAGFGRMALRELVGKGVLGFITCGVTGIVSCFAVLFGDRRQGVHDSLASTIVVRMK